MIPRVVHHVWVGDPMPDHLRGYMDTWKAHHPGWEHLLWTEGDLGWLRNHTLFNDALRWAPGSVGQFRSDIARYEILHLHGGIYVDCDMECRRPFDDLLDLSFFAGWETDGLWINNAVLGSVPGHPLLAELIERLPGNVEATRGARPNVMTGPQFVTPIARRHDITILPSAELYPYRWDELDRGNEPFPDARAVHHWENRRKKVGAPRG